MKFPLRDAGRWSGLVSTVNAGILPGSLITGASVVYLSTTDLSALLWLAEAFVAAFCLRTPVENSLRASPFPARGSASANFFILPCLDSASSPLFACRFTDSVRHAWPTGEFVPCAQAAHFALVLPHAETTANAPQQARPMLI